MFLLVTVFALSHIMLVLPPLLPAFCAGTSPVSHGREDLGKEWESARVGRRGKQSSCHTFFSLPFTASVQYALYLFMGYITGNDFSNGLAINPPSSHKSLFQPSQLGKVGALWCVRWRNWWGHLRVTCPADGRGWEGRWGGPGPAHGAGWRGADQGTGQVCASPRVLFGVLAFMGVSVSQAKQKGNWNK